MLHKSQPVNTGLFPINIPQSPTVIYMLLQHYKINDKTMALAPAKEIEYDTIVYETDRKFYIKQTAIQLIHQACLNHWSTYEGRRKAVMHQTGYKEKVPIPIHLKKEIIAFPTHAIKHFDCCWLFYHHVFHYESINDHPEFTSIYG